MATHNQSKRVPRDTTNMAFATNNPWNVLPTQKVPAQKEKTPSNNNNNKQQKQQNQQSKQKQQTQQPKQKQQQNQQPPQKQQKPQQQQKQKGQNKGQKGGKVEDHSSFPIDDFISIS